MYVIGLYTTKECIRTKPNNTLSYLYSLFSSIEDKSTSVWIIVVSWPPKWCKQCKHGSTEEPMTTYLVTLIWSGGHFGQLEVPSSNPRAATRRAWFAAISHPLQWFDLPYEDVDFEVFDEDSDTPNEPILVIFDNATE